MKENGVDSNQKSMFWRVSKMVKLRFWTIFGLTYFFVCLVINYEKKYICKDELKLQNFHE